MGVWSSATGSQGCSRLAHVHHTHSQYLAFCQGSSPGGHPMPQREDGEGPRCSPHRQGGTTLGTTVQSPLVPQWGRAPAVQALTCSVMHLTGHPASVTPTRGPLGSSCSRILVSGAASGAGWREGWLREQVGGRRLETEEDADGESVCVCGGVLRKQNSPKGSRKTAGSAAASWPWASHGETRLFINKKQSPHKGREDGESRYLWLKVLLSALSLSSPRPGLAGPQGQTQPEDVSGASPNASPLCPRLQFRV